MSEDIYAGIIHAVSIEDDGGGHVLEGQAISDAIRDERLAWVHLRGDDPASRAWVEREISYLDELIIDALLAQETRPRMLEFESGVLLILRGVNLNEDADPEDMVSIRLWVDPHRIISIQNRQLRAVQDIVERILAGRGPKNSGDFVTMLAGRLLERMEPVLQSLDERLDDIEETVIEKPDVSERQPITDIRKEAIILRRYIAPQRDAVSQLRGSELSWLEHVHRRRLQEAQDRTTRYIEDLDTIRERAAIVKDELSNVLADKMNKNMYILSVIAAIFLPLGFLTGLLGVNVGGIPGADNEASFTVFCLILSGVVLFQVLLFKKMKWF